MDIAKCTDYFHDGYIYSIVHKNNVIDFYLESSVIEPEEIDDKMILSINKTFKGILSVSNIKQILIGNEKYDQKLNMSWDVGDILDLEIDNNRVYLLIEWKNFPPKPRESNVDEIEIEAEKISWLPEE